jgi:type III secretion protein D
MSASTCLRQLRILSGTHAGASLDLGAGVHSLGDRPDCDISITDWRFQALALHLEVDGMAIAKWDDPTPHALRFEDFMPIDFDGVIVCIGACDGEWPARQELLARLRSVGAAIAPVPAVAPRRRLDRRTASWAAMALIGLVSSGWIVTATSKPSAEPRMTLQSARADLQQALDRAAAGHVTVSELQGGLAVDGLVDDALQARAVAHAIDAVPPQFEVARRYSIAADVIETIRSAVDLPGARIDYRGGGVFAIDVRSADVEATRAAIARVAADLAPTVRRLDPLIEETAGPPARTPAVKSSWVSTDGTNVMETRDGVKHLVPAEPPPDDSSPAPEPAIATHRSTP